jgi:hypothetical protein
MKFKRRVIASRKGQSVNIPKVVTENWGITSECELEYDEPTSTLTIRPARTKYGLKG